MKWKKNLELCTMNAPLENISSVKMQRNFSFHHVLRD